MKKTLYMLRMLLGKSPKEASNTKVLKLLMLLTAEYALNRAHKAWVGGGIKRVGLSSRQINEMIRILFKEARRRMKK